MLVKDIRYSNRKLVANCFVNNEELITSEIAKLTNLSVVSVNSILEEMISDKEIVVGEKKSSKGGRPSVAYHYNNDYYRGLVVYGYSHNEGVTIYSKVINSLGIILEEESSFFKTVNQNHITDIVNKYNNIKKILFGFPGFINKDHMDATEFASFLNTNFLNSFDVPVDFVTDVNATIFGDENEGIPACILFPNEYAPGAGIKIKNQLLTGEGNFAGEVSHIVDVDWPKLKNKGDNYICYVVSRIIVGLSCVVAPTKITLYSEFINENIFKLINVEVANKLKGLYMPRLELSNNFSEDFSKGIVKYLVHKIDEVIYRG